MENPTDYLNYVLAAYLVASITLGALLAVTLCKYFNLKSKFKKNEK